MKPKKSPRWKVLVRTHRRVWLRLADLTKGRLEKYCFVVTNFAWRGIVLNRTGWSSVIVR